MVEKHSNFERSKVPTPHIVINDNYNNNDAVTTLIIDSGTCNSHYRPSRILKKCLYACTYFNFVFTQFQLANKNLIEPVLSINKPNQLKAY